MVGLTDHPDMTLDVYRGRRQEYNTTWSTPMGVDNNITDFVESMISSKGCNAYNSLATVESIILLRALLIRFCPDSPFYSLFPEFNIFDQIATFECKFGVIYQSSLTDTGSFHDCLRIISIFHGCMVWIEKSVTRVTDRHHEACLVMPNSDPE